MLKKDFCKFKFESIGKNNFYILKIIISRYTRSNIKIIIFRYHSSVIHQKCGYVRYIKKVYKKSRKFHKNPTYFALL